MFKLIQVFLFISLLALSGYQQGVAQPLILPFPADDVKLIPSWIKQREFLNIAYLHQLDPERLLHNFRSDFDTLEKKYGGVWAPYYTFHKIMQGLLDVYTLTGNKKAYQLVLNMADYVEARMSKLPEAEIEKILYSAEANPSNEAGGMNDVLHNLYAVTKNPKHLKLAEIFDRRWFYQPLTEGKDILSGLHSNTHIILVNGYARRYENTGETDFRHAVENFWDMLLNHHAYVNGTSSGPRPISTTPTSRVAEHWGHPDHLSATFTGQIAESCVTHNAQRITADLFCWTADPKYADAYMNTFYNAVLPIQNNENGQVVYHITRQS